MKVKAPKGYHWMKAGKGSPKLMKHTGKFVKHKGASTLQYNFAVQKSICGKYYVILNVVTMGYGNTKKKRKVMELEVYFS